MAISEPTFEFRVDRNVPVPMRDGTVLRADVYRPRTEGVFPVLVGRVGYRLRDWPMDFYTRTGEYYAQRGYVVVWQNVRGTFASEGRFHPFMDDAWGANRDGYDTIEWAALQPWANGKVAMLGASYSGLTRVSCRADAPATSEGALRAVGMGVCPCHDVSRWRLHAARDPLVATGDGAAPSPGRDRALRGQKQRELAWRGPWGRSRLGTTTSHSSHAHPWKGWLIGIMDGWTIPRMAPIGGRWI